MRERQQGLDFCLLHKALNLVPREPILVRGSGNTPAVVPWADQTAAADWRNTQQAVVVEGWRNTQAEVVQESPLAAADWRSKPVAAALPELARPPCHTLAAQEAVLANKAADLPEH